MKLPGWFGRRAKRNAAQLSQARREGRKAGYAAGVVAAVDAILSDLEKLGDLDDAEVVEHDQDGAPMVCKGCELRRMGYDQMAARLEFAIDVEAGQTP